MKIPTARKLPSGSWTVRVRVNGKDISITRDTEKECIAEAVAVKAGGKRMVSGRKTLREAIDDYIAIRENVLSPSTIRGYKKIRNNQFQQAMMWDVNHTPQEKWQSAINLEAKKVSSKTLKNAWGFVSSAIHEATGIRYECRLPQVVSEERNYLTHEEIPIFVEAIKGTKVEVAALLALSSLRRSEIMSVKWDDIDLKRGVVTVHGSAVYNSDYKIVHREENKNKSSRRTVPVFPPLREAMARADKKGTYVINNSPSRYSKKIKEICIAAGITPVTLHGLRHSFASLAYYLQIPEEITRRIGGWADGATMHKIYTHIAEQDIAREAQAMSDFFG